MLSTTYNSTGDKGARSIGGMQKGLLANIIRMTFILCVIIGLGNAFLFHPVEDAVSGLIIGVVGVICFCAYFTPGGISPTKGMVWSVCWIIACLIFGAVFAPDFMSVVFDKVQYYSELYIFALFNPMRLGEGWWKTSTVAFFVATFLACTSVGILGLTGSLKV